MSTPFAVDKNHLYKNSQTTFKIYGTGANTRIKLINFSKLRQKGFEYDFDYEFLGEEKAKRGTKNTQKLQESISRTKNHIFDLAFCNNWEFFFTGTLDKVKYDRTDLKKFSKDFSYFIRDFNKKNLTNVKYLIVPELHSDKVSWHFHGFLMGIPEDFLYQFQLGDNIPKRLSDKVKSGSQVFKWIDYADKFGFCDLEPIQNHEAVSKYITKYINKDLEKSVTELNAHKYYASLGLQRGQVIKTQYFAWAEFSKWYKQVYGEDLSIYEAKYCSLCWLPYSDLLYQKIQEYFYSREK